MTFHDAKALKMSKITKGCCESPETLDSMGFIVPIDCMGLHLRNPRISLQGLMTRSYHVGALAPKTGCGVSLQGVTD
jgi:hypothetical protein